MMRADEYMGHWLVVHEASSFMRHCCDDLQTSQRVSYREALFAWLGAKNMYPRETTVTETVTPRGATCWKETDTKEAVRNVIRQQWELMPAAKRPQHEDDAELETVTHAGVTIAVGEKMEVGLDLGGASAASIAQARPWRGDGADAEPQPGPSKRPRHEEPQPGPSKRPKHEEPPESGGQEPVSEPVPSAGVSDPWTEMEAHFRNVPVPTPDEARENLDLIQDEITSATTPFSAALEALEELASYNYP